MQSDERHPIAGGEKTSGLAVTAYRCPDMSDPRQEKIMHLELLTGCVRVSPLLQTAAS